MNRFTIIASSVLLVLAACAKVTPVQPKDQEITFAVANYAQATKARSAFDTEQTFGTFAYWTPSNWYTDGTTHLFMNNEEIVYGGGVWAPVSPRFWPKSGRVSFASYAPYSTSGGKYGYGAAPAYSYDHQFTFADYTIVPEANVDLMIADDNNNKDCTNTTNTDGETVISGENVNDFKGVPTIFRHVLTQVRFLFWRTSFGNPNIEEAESWIELNLVQLVGMNDTNTFTDNTWDLDAATGKQTYTLYDGTETGGLKIARPGEEPTLAHDPMILLPQILQTRSEDGGAIVRSQQLVLTYSICTKFKSNPVVQRQEGLTASVTLGQGGLDEWHMNEDITYNVTISPITDTPITFDPAVADWTHLTGELSNE